MTKPRTYPLSTISGGQSGGVVTALFVGEHDLRHMSGDASFRQEGWPRNSVPNEGKAVMPRSKKTELSRRLGTKAYTSTRASGCSMRSRETSATNQEALSPVQIATASWFQNGQPGGPDDSGKPEDAQSSLSN